MPTTDKRKKKEKQKKSGRKDPTQQTKINLTAIAPPATTRKPYDNLISFDGTQVEELAVLRRLLPNDGSHPYKESPYDLGSNIQPRTRGYLDKYNTELPNLHNEEFGDEDTYVAIQDLLLSVFNRYHVDTRLNARFTEDTRGRYLYSEELTETLQEISDEIKAENEDGIEDDGIEESKVEADESHDISGIDFDEQQ